MYEAFIYVISNDGIDTQSSYPFKGKVGDPHVPNHLYFCIHQTA